MYEMNPEAVKKACVSLISHSGSWTFTFELRLLQVAINYFSGSLGRSQFLNSH